MSNALPRQSVFKELEIVMKAIEEIAGEQLVQPGPLLQYEDRLHRIDSWVGAGLAHVREARRA